MNLAGSPETLAWLAAIGFAAGSAKGLTGFGGALIMAPLSGMLIGLPDAATLVVLVHCATSLQGVRSWAASVDWRPVVLLAIIAVIVAAISTHFMAYGDVTTLRHGVALVVLAGTGLNMAGWRWRHDGSWAPTLAAGLASGILTALGGLGGPPAVYYFGATHRGAALRANLLGFFALLFGGATVLLIVEHRIRMPQLGTAAAVIPAFAAGVLLGERIGGKLSVRWFDRLISGLLLGAGVVALLT